MPAAPVGPGLAALVQTLLDGFAAPITPPDSEKDTVPYWPPGPRPRST
jgi:hypothetical protein